MACATLKRSLDFDPVHNAGNPAKRQRCIPMCISPSNSPSNSPPGRIHENASSPSAFADVCPKLSAEKMVNGIREEIRRLYRQKQLHFNPKLEPSSIGEASESSSPTSLSSNFPTGMRDKPLFTFRQVSAICERLISDREKEIREEYDRFLTMKLTEQYEAFVRFSNDQLQRSVQTGTSASYLS